jgi:hypothetical protein
MSDEPLDLDKHRGMAARKATDIRRVLAKVENNARDLRDRQGVLENQLISVPAASWPEAAAKARYLLNLYATGLAPSSRSCRGRTCRLCPALQGKLSVPLNLAASWAAKGSSILICVARLNCRQSVDRMSR